jgi:hypothetical protein
MRRALPLAALALLAAGCGGRTYSDADVRHAFAGFQLEQAPLQIPPAFHPTFATWAAATELRIDEGSAVAAAYYSGNGVEIARYRSPEEAAVASSSLIPVLLFVRAGHEPPRLDVERHGNLVLIVSGRRRAVAAAVARLP